VIRAIGKTYDFRMGRDVVRRYNPTIVKTKLVHTIRGMGYVLKAP